MNGLLGWWSFPSGSRMNESIGILDWYPQITFHWHLGCFECQLRCQSSVNWVLPEDWLGCWLFVDQHIDCRLIKGMDKHLTAEPLVHMIFHASHTAVWNHLPYSLLPIIVGKISQREIVLHSYCITPTFCKCIVFVYVAIWKPLCTSCPDKTTDCN